MRFSLRHNTLLALLLTFVAITSHAKTASEVYEQASKSTVVVEGIHDKKEDSAQGSGVILSDGNVVTNCHVIKGASQLTVRSEKKEYLATLQYSDWERDICSLSVKGLSGQAAVIGNSKTLKVGVKVYAVGAPNSLELTLSDGIVSSLRDIKGGNYIQTTAAISPGSSGGGLFDEDGALVGLTTFYYEGQNLNFAVPVEWVTELPKRNTKKILADTQPVTEWLNKAAELEARKDWPAMIELSLRWVKKTPDSGIAWYSLGVAYGKNNQPTKAIEAFQQSIRIDPEHAGAWYNLGVAYRNNNQFTKAIEAYQQSIRIDPEHAMAWYNLGITYDKNNQPTKAIKAYQQAIRINPEHAGAWYNLGSAYGNNKQLTKAIEAFQQAIRINPEFADAWYNLGNAYALSGQRDKVIEVYKKLKTLDPVIADEFFKGAVLP